MTRRLNEGIDIIDIRNTDLNLLLLLPDFQYYQACKNELGKMIDDPDVRELRMESYKVVIPLHLLHFRRHMGQKLESIFVEEYW
jgi:hypothetical protein